MERKSPVAGEIYRHFKNKLYQIVGVAKHSETKEKMVIYQALYDDFGMYARPYDMFMSEVDNEKYPDVTQKYRFEKVGRVGEEDEDVKVNNTDDEEKPNPDLMAFLAADTYEQKRALLISMRSRMTDRLINDIAASIDVTVDEGDLDTRYKSLLYCVSKLDEFEITRLR